MRGQGAGGLVLGELDQGAHQRLGRHGHDPAFFCLLLDGDYEEHVGRARYRYGPGDVAFHPAGLEHSGRIGARGSRVFGVELDPTWLERLAGGRLPSEVCFEARGSELAWLALRLHREWKRAEPCSDLALEGLTLEMLAVAGRVALRGRPPAWVARLEGLLAERFDERWTLARLGAELGLAPLALARGFRRWRGEAVSERLQRLRVRAACDLLARAGSSLTDVAAAAGFCDQSHLTRVFKRVTGTSPSTFRAARRSF